MRKGWKIMKTAAVRLDSNATPDRRFPRHRSIGADVTLGWSYWRAAETDEKNGFPLTAAMEWHQAAECFGSVPLISDLCWREWERILHLPRQFASPIVESNEVVLSVA
jgi:hypothetical protein